MYTEIDIRSLKKKLSIKDAVQVTVDTRGIPLDPSQNQLSTNNNQSHIQATLSDVHQQINDIIAGLIEEGQTRIIAKKASGGDPYTATLSKSHVTLSYPEHNAATIRYSCISNTITHGETVCDKRQIGPFINRILELFNDIEHDRCTVMFE